MKRTAFLLFLNILFGVLLLGSIWSASFLSSYIHWLVLLGISFPFWYLFQVVFLIYWVLNKSYYALLPIGLLLLGGSSLTSNFGVNYFQEADREAETLKIISFNIYSLYNFEEKGKRVDANTWKAFIDDAEADLFCFQEYQHLVQFSSLYKAHRKVLATYESCCDSVIGPAIFSKYPIIDSQIYPISSDRNFFISADIQIKGRVVRVFNVHLKSNRITKVVDRVFRRSSLGKVWRNFRSLSGRYMKNAQIRVEEARMINKWIKESPYPVIVCGDFNEVPQSLTYQILTSQLRDGFRERGKGWGGTFKRGINGLRIDYILADQRFKIQESGVLKSVDFSDHYPIWSTLGLPPD